MDINFWNDLRDRFIALTKQTPMNPPITKNNFIFYLPNAQNGDYKYSQIRCWDIRNEPRTHFEWLEKGNNLLGIELHFEDDSSITRQKCFDTLKPIALQHNYTIDEHFTYGYRFYINIELGTNRDQNIQNAAAKMFTMYKRFRSAIKVFLPYP